MMTRAAVPPLASPRLRRLAQRPAPPREEPLEQCELCGRPIPSEHRHVLELDERNLLCACRPCALLFDKGGAAAGRRRLVPDRRLRLNDLRMPDELWDALRIPVDMAFFFENTSVGRVCAYYPSPMGPTESELELDAWADVEARNRILRSLEPDVEALLVNRARGQRRAWLVPIEDCYALVAVIRTHWRGFSGGREVWDELDGFFTELDRKSKPAFADAEEGRS
jgi:hypothetical protein